MGRGSGQGNGQGNGKDQRRNRNKNRKRRELRGQMNPSRLFILRPVATTLLMAGILLAGIVAYRQLPVSALPQVDYPTIQVLTFYPGARSERDRVVGDRAARTAVRAGAGPEADDLDQYVWRRR